jgi:formylglycine-generating enzyme required for sulfatase activity
MIVGVAVAIVLIGAFLALQLFGSGDGDEKSAQASTPVEDAVSTDVSAIIPETETPVPSVTTPTVDEATPEPTTMVPIPAGVYRVGFSASGDSYAPPQSVELDEFWIDLYEVTNAEYASFLADTGRPVPAGWTDGTIPAGQEDHPVEGIDWETAVAYCEWANKRLPTEAEWEVVARGAVDWLYPWGNDEGAVELPRGGTYPVGSVSGNRSPFGVYDMAGNVWEWVGETYAPVAEGHRMLRGGAHGFLKDMAFRLHGDPNIPTMFATAGVRCAAD